jgi:hypothetical protein
MASIGGRLGEAPHHLEAKKDGIGPVSLGAIDGRVTLYAFDLLEPAVRREAEGEWGKRL